MKEMKPLNPIFSNTNRTKDTVKRKEIVRKEPITKAEGRQTRIDKKKDVKIPLTDEERQLIKRLARRRGMEPTPYCSLMVKQALKLKGQAFKVVPYNPKGKPYPAKLEVYYHNLLFDKTVEWDCSLKEAAYRLLIYMVNQERIGY